MKVLTACRGDGLTERINAILNGLVICKKMGWGFKFTWPEFLGSKNSHSVSDSVYELFSDDFIDKHFVEDENAHYPDGFSPRNNKQIAEYTVSSLEELEESMNSNRAFYLAPLRMKPSLTSHLGEINKLELLCDNMFAPETQKALENSVSCHLSNRPVSAVHLRGGDVVYDKARTWGQFIRNKTMSVPIADYFCKKAAENGEDVLLFGATKSDLELVQKKNPNVRLASEFLLSGLKPDSEMLSEVVLMSRCAKLFSAGGTGVTYLASELSGLRLTKFDGVLSKEKEYEIYKKALSSNELSSEMSTLQLAFIHINAYVIYFHNSSFDVLDTHLSAAFALDGENTLYLCLLYLNALRFNEYDRAKQYLESNSSHFKHENLVSAMATFIKGKLAINVPTFKELVNIVLSGDMCPDEIKKIDQN